LRVMGNVLEGRAQEVGRVRDRTGGGRQAGRTMRFRRAHGEGDRYRYACRGKKICIAILGRPPGIFTCTPNTPPGATEKTSSGVCHAPGSTA